MKIIGLAGGSGSGKTTLSNQLKQEIPNLTVIGLDSYYKDGSLKPLEERKKVNYDHPDSIEYSLVKKQLNELRAGENICVPQYEYTSMTRKKECTPVVPNDYIVLEGILIFGDKELVEMLDYILYIDIDRDVRLERNCKRDIEQRGRSREQVVERFNNIVDPMHDKFVEPFKNDADYLIKIDTPLEEVVQKILYL